MTTARATIFREIDRRLEAVPGVAEYERMPSGDWTSSPALHAFDDGDREIESETGVSRMQLKLIVQGWVTGKESQTSGSDTHDEVLQLHADVVFALCGDAGTNLGGLVENIEIDGDRLPTRGDLSKDRRLGFRQDFAITFATKRGNPAEFA